MRTLLRNIFDTWDEILGRLTSQMVRTVNYEMFAPSMRCAMIDPFQIEFLLLVSVIWALIISIAAMGVVTVSSLIQVRFMHSPLATVVESTIYPVYEIPFPAVTICNYNRLDWNRVDEVIELYGANVDFVEGEKCWTNYIEYFFFQLFAARKWNAALAFKDIPDFARCFRIWRIWKFHTIEFEGMVIRWHQCLWYLS